MSEKDKNTERIKELLRQKLEAAEQEADGWNVPSSGVWTGLSEELGAGKAGRRRGLRYILLISALVGLSIILTMRECGHQRQFRSLHHLLELTKDSLSQLREECIQKESLSQLSPTPGPATSSNHPAHLQAASPGNANLRNFTDKKLTSGYPDSTDIDPPNALQLPKRYLSQGSTNPSALPSAAPVGVSLHEDSIHSHEWQAVPGFLEMPSLSPIDYSQQPIALQPKATRTNRKKAIQWYGSFRAGVSAIGSHFAGQPPAVIVDEKPLTAFRTGLGLEGVLSRHWSLETGLDLVVANTQTQYQLEFPFTHQNEFQHDDGNYDNTYNHNLPSPLGDYPAQLVLTRESTAIVQEGELMNLDLTIRQQIQLLSMPLRVKYAFGKAPFRFGVKAGLRTNVALGISSEYSSLVSHHGAIHQRQTSIGDPALSDLQKVTFDYSLGFDVTYLLSQRWSLFLESAYQHGINPVYQNATVKNYLQGGELGGGIRVRL
ncbi:MAG: outer membrane beta-barrel protein [Saprospiraceae bacterium]|nr:outer membrane beta-barrel protein [Saprospiraceae bacterium]